MQAGPWTEGSENSEFLLRRLLLADFCHVIEPA